jgi:hypothetical protein
MGLEEQCGFEVPERAWVSRRAPALILIPGQVSLGSPAVRARLKAELGSSQSIFLVLLRVQVRILRFCALFLLILSPSQT